MAERLIGKVRIYAADGSMVEDRCAGPSWFGGCPRSSAERPVACAGRRIEVTTPSGRRVTLEVEADAVSCPLVALAAGLGRASDEAG